VGLRIFAHAITLVFSHIGFALRISALLYLVPAVLYELVIATVVRNPDPLLALRIASPIFLFLAAAAALWIAVGWHRYILLDEAPGVIAPPFRGDRVLAYFGNSLLVGLIAFGIALVVFLPVGFIAAIIGRAGGTISYLVLLLPLASYFVIAVLVYRVSLILPASAIGKPIKLSEAWAATRGSNGTFFALAIVSVLCAAGLTFPVLWITPNLGALAGFVWQTATSWIELMVGVSIITTLYGYYVEKRALP